MFLQNGLHGDCDRAASSGFHGLPITLAFNGGCHGGERNTLIPQPFQAIVDQDPKPLIPSLQVVDDLGKVFPMKVGLLVFQFEYHYIVYQKVQFEVVDNLPPVFQILAIMTQHVMPFGLKALNH